MKRTMKGLLAVCTSITMLWGSTISVFAFDPLSLPMYQWVEVPTVYEDGEYVSDEDDPLMGTVSYGTTGDTFVIRTDLEEVTAEVLGLPETAEILEVSSLHMFQALKASYIYSQNYYWVKADGAGQACKELLMENPDVDVVVQEYRTNYMAHGRLGVMIYTTEDAELTVEDFPDLMVEEVDNLQGKAHAVFLYEEAFENGIDYNVLYEAIESDMELGISKLSRICTQYGREGGYAHIEIVPNRYEYVLQKGEMVSAGDMDEDLVYEIEDATEILTLYAQYGAGLLPDDADLSKADYNQDGTVDIADATEVLTRYARVGAGLE